MVRILLFPCFFLSLGAQAHNSGQAGFLPELYCEHKLGALNHAQIDAYRFLKKLQQDTEAEFPADEFVRMTVGRAIAPLSAAMQQAGGEVANVPLEMNLRLGMTPAERENLWRVFQLYLPAIDGKKTVIMLYAENPVPVAIFSKLLREYLHEKNIQPKKLALHVFTSQMVLREMRTALLDNMYTFRPIGAANQVRHWFHDGLRPGLQNYSQFPIVDVHGKAVIDQIPPERQPYILLKQDLETLK